MSTFLVLIFFFFFNDTATTEIYTLSLHDALPICAKGRYGQSTYDDECARGSYPSGPDTCLPRSFGGWSSRSCGRDVADRKSTRLNSSHLVISYAVFCLKKKTNNGSPSTQPFTSTS